MPTNDQFGTPDPVFDILQESIVSYSTEKKTELGIPTEAITNITAESTSWGDFWGIAKDKKTASPVDNENKKAERIKYVAYLRTFVKLYYYDNPKATDSDIMSAGLKVHKETHSKAVPEESSVEVPVVSITNLPGYLMKLKCLNVSGKTGKPQGIVFIRVRWIVADELISNPKFWINFTDNTKGIVELKFLPEDAGKKLTIAVCYVTKSGKEATYCTNITTKVPVI